MSVDSTAGRDGLRELYGAAYPRLVAVVGAVCGDRDLAAEAVQDAFVRLVGQWPKVSRYDDPEAWLRKVALGYVSKRRRKAANGARALLRLGAPRDVPAVSAEAVDLDRALASLPQAQRAVVVLRELGLDLTEIARELGVAEGTVKSRLSRARAALAPLLREDETSRA